MATAAIPASAARGEAIAMAFCTSHGPGRRMPSQVSTMLVRETMSGNPVPFMLPLAAPSR